jgi:hypothetical protein
MDWTLTVETACTSEMLVLLRTTFQCKDLRTDSTLQLFMYFFIYKLLAKLGSNIYIFHFYHCLPSTRCGMIWGAVSRLTCQGMQRLFAGGK